MLHRCIRRVAYLAALAIALGFSLARAGGPPASTSFKFQGQLSRNGALLSGHCDFKFSLWELPALGSQIGSTITVSDINVVNGWVARGLDFTPPGNVIIFAGSLDRYLQIEVRSPAGSGAFVNLGRQQIKPVPYALHALGPWVTTGPNVSYSAGNVGIGTTIPAARLHVAGNELIQTPFLLMFGPVGNFNSTAENTDAIYFQRNNPTNNSSILDLVIGDDSGSALDGFTISTTTDGVGPSTPRFTFLMDGTASKTGGGSWASLSDERSKSQIEPLCGALDMLLSLRGRTYVYKPEFVASGRALPGRQIGLVAQEVERGFPDWVRTGPDGLKTVTERSTTALMVESLRELRDEKDTQIAALAAQNQQLASANDDLRKRLAAIEATVERLAAQK